MEPGRIKFRITGTGAQRRVYRVPNAYDNSILRWVYLRVITATAATGSLYLYDDDPVDTAGTKIGTVSGVTVDEGGVTTGVDPTTVPSEHLRYSKTGVAMTASTTASSINEAPATQHVLSGAKFIMVDMTAATGAWDVKGFITFGPF
jgi:hypothetical protein